MNIKRAIVLLLILAFLPMAVVAQDATATIRVETVFGVDKNPNATVRVELDCNDGVIKVDTNTIRRRQIVDMQDGDGQTFDIIVGGTMEDGETLDCTVTADGVSGYRGKFDARCLNDVATEGCGADVGALLKGANDDDNDVFTPYHVQENAGSCSFTDIKNVEVGNVEAEWGCTIDYQLMEVIIDVDKIWNDEHPEFNNSIYARADMKCDKLVASCHSPSGGQMSPSTEDEDTQDMADQSVLVPPIVGRLNFTTGNQSDDFRFCPDWNGGTTCELKEIMRDSFVESETDCVFLGVNAIFPGEFHECTLTNTRIYEGVPTLSQYGLALMALLMVGVGMVGFRRFA